MKLLCAALLFSALSGMAQTDSTIKNKPANKFRFQSAVLVGVLEGETGTSFQAQATGGVAWRRWFAGAGAGIDYYFFRSFPVFVDVRRNILKGRKTPFVYADGGINFPWAKNNTESFGYTVDYKSGWYYDAGVGFSLQTKKSGTYLISLGFSEKEFTEYSSYQFIIDDVFRNTEPYKDRFDYKLRRLTLKAGVRF